MLSSQLFWRVFGVYAALTMGTAFAFAMILSVQQRDAVRNEAVLRVQETSDGIRALLAQEGFDGTRLAPETAQRLDAMTSRATCRVALFDSSGEKLWQNHASDTAWSLAIDHPESSIDRFLSATDLGRGLSLRPLPINAGNREDSEALYFAQRVSPTNDASGTILVALPMRLLLADLSTVQSQLWAAAATIGLLALAITYVVVGRIIGPLETLTHAAQQIIAGEQPNEVVVRSHNEIGTLASVFNSMNRQLLARIGDLQEQRRQQEANHQRLETVFGAMYEGVIAVDAEERILFANNAAIRLMDLKPTSMVGRPIWEAIRQQSLHDLVREAIDEDGLKQVEIDVVRTQSTVAVTASRLPGTPTPGAVIVIHDVTELRRLENLRRDFVQNVSHELKTPLSAISAYADTLLEGGLEDPECNRHFTQRISEQADRLHHLIIDLLALARMESADDGFEVEPVDFTRVLNASIDAHAGPAQAKRITLTTESPAESILGLADEEGLRTIIDNLLDNALNYTPVGGHVTVRWKSSGERITIEVQDTGPGIAHEHQQRIFQRFYRIDKARSRELGGTGLGLSIVKHLCQVFGGTITVHSYLGMGSTFTVELRAASQTVLR